MWELKYTESWALKTWCFWSMVLEKTIESPLDSKVIKSVSQKFTPEYSLEGLMLKLKLQYLGYLMRRTDSRKWESVLGKFEGRRKSRWERMSLSPSLTQRRRVWASYGSWWWTEEHGVPQFLGLQIVGPSNWTELVLGIESQLQVSLIRSLGSPKWRKVSGLLRRRWRVLEISRRRKRQTCLFAGCLLFSIFLYSLYSLVLVT